MNGERGDWLRVSGARYASLRGRFLYENAPNKEPPHYIVPCLIMSTDVVVGANGAVEVLTNVTIASTCLTRAIAQ